MRSRAVLISAVACSRLAVGHVVVVIRPRAAGAGFGGAFEGEGAGHRAAQSLAARLISSLPSSLAASAIGTIG